MRLKKSVGPYVIPKKVLEEKFRRFVEEDVGQGDITTLLTVPSGTIVEAKILVKEYGIIAGIEATDIYGHQGNDAGNVDGHEVAVKVGQFSGPRFLDHKKLHKQRKGGDQTVEADMRQGVLWQRKIVEYKK